MLYPTERMHGNMESICEIDKANIEANQNAPFVI